MYKKNYFTLIIIIKKYKKLEDHCKHHKNYEN